MERGPGAWKTLGVSCGVPRTVKAIDTAELIRLDAEAIAYGFNRNHGAGWLADYAALEAVHYLRPVFVHRAERRPEFFPHWRCTLLLTMRDGQEAFSLLDVWPASFDPPARGRSRTIVRRGAHSCAGAGTRHPGGDDRQDLEDHTSLGAPVTSSSPAEEVTGQESLVRGLPVGFESQLPESLPTPPRRIPEPYADAAWHIKPC